MVLSGLLRAVRPAPRLLSTDMPPIGTYLKAELGRLRCSRRGLTFVVNASSQGRLRGSSCRFSFPLPPFRPSPPPLKSVSMTCPRRRLPGQGSFRSSPARRPRWRRSGRGGRRPGSASGMPRLCGAGPSLCRAQLCWPALSPCPTTAVRRRLQADDLGRVRPDDRVG